MASYLATLRPPHYKFKRKVLYKQVDVEAWLEGCRVDSSAVAANEAALWDAETEANALQWDA